MGGKHKTKVDRGICFRINCGEPVYLDGMCVDHHAEKDQVSRLAHVTKGQPTHPDLLPVQPKKVEWSDAGWAVWLPLVEAAPHQPCQSHPYDFFAEDQERGGAVQAKVRRARESCGRCLDRVACREFGIAHSRDHGVWGGTTPDERAAILRARGQVHVELHSSWHVEPVRRQEAS